MDILLVYHGCRAPDLLHDLLLALLLGLLLALLPAYPYTYHLKPDLLTLLPPVLKLLKIWNK